MSLPRRPLPFQFIVLEEQHPAAAKSFFEIVLTATLFGLEAGYLRGDTRFVKVSCRDGEVANLAAFMDWVRCAPIDDDDEERAITLKFDENQ